MGRGNRLAFVLMGLVGSLGLGLLAASFVDYDFLKQTADRFSGSGDADGVTPEFHAQLVLRLRLFGSLLLALGLPVYALRRALGAWGASWSKSCGAFGRDAVAHVASAWRESTGFRLVLALIFAIGAWLRLRYLDQPLRFDEGWTFLSFAQMPFPYIPLRYNVPNNHIAHSLLVKLSTGLFGEAEWAIRLPAFLFGLLVLPLAFLALRLLYGARAALLGSALVGAASSLIEYSTNARGYTLVVACFLAMLLIGHYALTRRSIAGWTWLAATGALGAFTMPIMALPAAVVFAWLALASGRSGRLLADVFLAGAGMTVLTLVIYAPTLAVNGLHSLTDNSGVQPGTVADVVREAPAFVSGLFGIWNRDYPAALAIALAVCAGLAVVLHRRVAPARAPIAPALLAVVVLFLVAISDFGFPRVWLFVLPLYLGLAGAGLAWILELAFAKRRRAGTATLALAALLAPATALWVAERDSILLSHETGFFPTAELAIETLAPELRPGDLVSLYSTNATQLVYYARRRDVRLTPIGDFRHVRVFRCDANPAASGGAANAGPRAFLILNKAKFGLPLAEMHQALPDTIALGSDVDPLVRSGALEIHVATFTRRD